MIARRLARIGFPVISAVLILLAASNALPAPASDSHAPPLLLNEVCPQATGGSAWVELLNPGNEPASVGGAAIRFFGGGIVVLPDDAPDCPAGGTILLVFGEGAPDVGDTVIHPVSIAYRPKPAGDGCLLIIDGEAVDAISWGEPIRMANLRVPVGPPLQPDPGEVQGDTALLPGDVCARVPGTWPPDSPEWIGSRFWCRLPVESATPGSANHVSSPHCRPPVYREEAARPSTPGIAGFVRLEASMSMGGFPGGGVRVVEELRLKPGEPPESEEFAHRHHWEIGGDPARIPVPGRGAVTSSMSGGGEGAARVVITLDGEGSYRMVTDVRPRMGQYAITVSGPGVPGRTTNQPFHFGFADHHYGYVSDQAPPEIVRALHESGYPNVFEGKVHRLPDGSRVLRGSDTLTLPQALLGNLSGGTERTWEIRLNP